MEVRDRDPMLVVIKTATVTGEDGKPERLIAGRARVRAHHFLTRTYPHLFGPGADAHARQGHAA